MHDPYWLSQFRERMDRFGSKPLGDTEPLSIKIRVTGGCFHREHSPEAYRLIDAYLQTYHPKEEICFEEHESGPEILVYVAATTAGLALTKSLIDLVVTIIKARSAGIKKGDHPHQDLELIVRRFDRSGEYAEEKILRISSNEKIDAQKILKELEKHSLPSTAAKTARKTKKRG